MERYDPIVFSSLAMQPQQSEALPFTSIDTKLSCSEQDVTLCFDETASAWSTLSASRPMIAWSSSVNVACGSCGLA